MAICASLLCAETFLIANISPDWFTLFSVFLATLFIYNASRLTIAFSERLARKDRVIRIRGNIWHLVACLLSVLLLFIVLTNCTTQQVIIFLSTSILSLVYMMPFSLNGKKTKGIRNNPLFKNILLSLIWALATVSFPLAGDKNWDFSQELLFMFFRRFFFIYALTTIFDIKDIRADSVNGMETVALKFGVRGTKILATASLFMFCVFTYTDIYLHAAGMNELSVALYVSAAITAAIIAGTGLKRTKDYYTFVIDGAMALQFILVLFFRFA